MLSHTSKPHPGRTGHTCPIQRRTGELSWGRWHIWKATTECQTVEAPSRRRWGWPAACGRTKECRPATTHLARIPEVELHGALLPTLLGHPGHRAQLWPDWFGRLIQSPRSLMPLCQGSCRGPQAFASTVEEDELYPAFWTLALIILGFHPELCFSPWGWAGVIVGFWPLGCSGHA